MDHEALCDCPFVDRCSTFSDPLIDRVRKGPEGFGCHDQNDHHRGRHCRTFRCSYLTLLVADALAPCVESAARGSSADV